METEKNPHEVKKAFSIGLICIFSYFLSYYMRNNLGVLTPHMIESGLFTKESVALLSSTYCIVYAAGQLLNGTAGDYIKPKYMVLCGYLLGGAAQLLFSMINYKFIQILCFGVLGLGFSMLRGPLVKTISENTLPGHARVCCTFFSFSCYFGPLIASQLSLYFAWRTVFRISGIVALITAVLAFILLTLLEKNGVITYNSGPKGARQKLDILAILKLNNFVPYMLIGMIVEISSTSISFWITTYVNEHLHFTAETASIIFSVISIIKSVCPFLCLFLFKVFGENGQKLMRIMFALSALLYIGMVFAENVWLNILLFMLALASTACASSSLWSIYVPSLAKSGKVSGANGILDCTGYIGASAANVLFARAMSNVSWNGIILLWGGIMLIGFAVTFIMKKTSAEMAFKQG